VSPVPSYLYGTRDDRGGNDRKGQGRGKQSFIKEKTEGRSPLINPGAFW